MKRILLLLLGVLFSMVTLLQAQHTGVPSPTYADSLFTAGKHDQALKAYSRLLQEEPNNYDYRLRHALLLGWTGNYRDSELALRALYTENQNDWDAAAALIRVIAWQDRTLEAVRLSEQVLSRNPDNIELRALQVQMVFWYGHLRRADRLANRLALDAPNEPIVSTVQQAVREWMQPQSFSSYTYAWDSENIHTHVITQRFETGVVPGTSVNARVDYANVRNTLTSQHAQSTAFSLGGRHQINRSWSVLGGFSAVYTPDNTLTLNPSGAVIFRTNYTSYVLSASRFLLTDTPALISNAIYQNELELAANLSISQHELNLRVNHAWMSDDNRRFAMNGSYAYRVDFSDFTYTPSLTGAYRSFELSGFTNGYFAPEWQIWFALGQSLRWNVRPDRWFAQLSADVGMQQFQLHNIPAENPSLKYEGGLTVGYRFLSNFEAELHYLYSNLVGISSQSYVDDFWGQAVRITLRATI